MTAYERALREHERGASRLSREPTTSGPTYYPAIRSLLAATLRHLGLPADVRTSTSEPRPGGGTDLPDLALYDGGGDFPIVAGEVKRPAGRPLFVTPLFDLHLHARGSVGFAAILVLGDRLDDLYNQATADAWTSDGLSPRTPGRAS
jgi:hypothetical protein